VTERCLRCHRKKHVAQRPTSPDLCHRADSLECQTAARAYNRGASSVHSLVRQVVNDTCYDPDDGDLDSMGVGSYAAAIRYLASIGRVRIEIDRGTIVTGRWT